MTTFEDREQFLASAYLLHKILFEIWLSSQIRIADRRISRARKRLASARRKRAAVDALKVETYAEFCQKMNRAESALPDTPTHIFEFRCYANRPAKTD